jgi:hypothetical protein
MRVFWVQIFILSLATVSCSRGPEAAQHSETLASQQVGSIRGLFAINQHIRASFLEEGVPGSAGFDLSKIAGAQVEQLRMQLGYQFENPSGNLFIGSTPNPFGLIVWQELLVEFGQSLGRVCDSGEAKLVFPRANDAQFSLAPEVFDHIGKICTTSDQGELRAEMFSHWYLANGGLDEAEGEIIIDELLKEDFQWTDLTPAQRVEHLWFASAYHPAFLLRQ